MNQYIDQPRMTKSGVVFSIRIGSRSRECLISEEALKKLSALKNVDASDADPMEIFHAFERTIDGAARRLITANVRGTPLLMQADTFP
ncbi:MAG: hypothetical protein JWQ21_1024 [Herminiimonas sp.]|nr:hypothetical protein [Herminiimonas sp.]